MNHKKVASMQMKKGNLKDTHYKALKRKLEEVK